MGKRLTVYPIAVDRSGDSERFDFEVPMAEVVGVLLERLGMVPEVSSESVPVTPADGLSAMEAKIRQLHRGRKNTTDYTLLVSFTGKPTKTGPSVAKICIVVTDSTGNTVWSREETEFPGGPPVVEGSYPQCVSVPCLGS